MSMQSRTILCIHQSAELYGSDRSFLDAVSGFIERGLNVIVCLSDTGPLIGELLDVGAQVKQIRLTKIARNSLSIAGLWRMLKSVIIAHRDLVRLARENNIVGIYSNTIAVIDGAFVAKRLGLPHVWHVREIIEKPMVVGEFFRLLVKRFSSAVIVNSGETKRWLTNGGDWGLPVDVIWNGISVPPEELLNSNASTLAREHLGIPPGKQVVLLAGRINEWKGHWLLLDAVSSLTPQVRNNLIIVFAGDVSRGKEYLKSDLERSVATHGLTDSVMFLGFVDDMSKVYPAADLSLVPSLYPEPFGRTAVESMSWKIPVIAANHGGLREIIDDGVSGWLFNPGDRNALASAISNALSDVKKLDEIRNSAYVRVNDFFSVKQYCERVHSAVVGALPSFETT